MLALRKKGKPIIPPSYGMRDVPRCSKGLFGSVIQEVAEREHFVDSMGELLLLCNEVMRRQQRAMKKKKAKPLSLEYIADRLDVDDPISGYFVRTARRPAAPPARAASEVDKDRDVVAPDGSRWVEGMLQGFIVVTTFTNWQKTFRWDSMHENAFSYDSEELAEKMKKGERIHDADGTISEELQSSVRCGDPWNEGIIWPRIAEISLLGGLGCGKALLSLVIENLENMSSSPKKNYDYVVLQATDNSVPFYESMGFVRVGAISEDDEFDQKQRCGTGNLNNNGDDISENLQEEHPRGKTVSSDNFKYVTTKPGETPKKIADKFGVDVWDIIFLSHYEHPDIKPKSWLYPSTTLHVPSKKAKDDAISNIVRNRDGCSTAMQWYLCNENDTPKSVAKKFNVNYRDVVKTNLDRLPGLAPTSRLMKGTRLKVSHFDTHHDKYIPYCHWTFPDDKFKDSEPSYMMARKLVRRRGPAKKRPIFNSLNVNIVPYCPKRTEPIYQPILEKVIVNTRTPTKQKAKHSDEPEKPKKPPSAFYCFMNQMREVMKSETIGMATKDIKKLVSRRWDILTDQEKEPFNEMAIKRKEKYTQEMSEYNTKLEALRQSNESVAETIIEDGTDDIEPSELFNKVVKFNSRGIRECGTEFEYYYVLTYLPDLQWCHLAPMIKRGRFGDDHPEVEGRPRWVLVNESEGKEIDTSAYFCVQVVAKEMKLAEDADEEEWDIIPGAVVKKTPKEAELKDDELDSIELPIAIPVTNDMGSGAVTEEDFFYDIKNVPKQHVAKQGDTKVRIVSSALPESLPMIIAFIPKKGNKTKRKKSEHDNTPKSKAKKQRSILDMMSKSNPWVSGSVKRKPMTAGK